MHITVYLNVYTFQKVYLSGALTQFPQMLCKEFSTRIAARKEKDRRLNNHENMENFSISFFLHHTSNIKEIKGKYFCIYYFPK